MSRSTVLIAAVAATAFASTAMVGAQSTRAASASIDELEGGKVPLTALIDNDKVRVSLLTFPPSAGAPRPSRGDLINWSCIWMTRCRGPRRANSPVKRCAVVRSIRTAGR